MYSGRRLCSFTLVSMLLYKAIGKFNFLLVPMLLYKGIWKFKILLVPIKFCLLYYSMLSRQTCACILLLLLLSK